jgi:UDP-glucuronate decarboxylase
LTPGAGPVVVTGASGFVGSALVAALRKEGFAPIEIDAYSEHGASQAIDILDAELADFIPEGCTVIHLAAVSSDAECKKNPISALRVNVEGVSKLVRACNKARAQRIIFASSEWIYGDFGLSPALTEGTDVSFESLKSLYASTKLYGEWLVANLAEIPYVALRFGIVYGARLQPQSWPEILANKAQNGQALEFGSGKSGRSFIYLDDIVEALTRVLKSDLFGTYNLGGAKFITVHEIVVRLSQTLGKKLELRERQADCPNQRNLVSRRIYDALGWSPKVDLEHGLRSLLGFEELARD